MKMSFFVFLLLSHFAFSQTEIGFDGFDKIRLGMSLSEIKKITKEVDEAPSYAWFQPSTDEEMRERYGDNADFYIQMRDEQLEIFSEMKLTKRWCIPKKSADQRFFNLSIQCIECVFEEDILVKISIVLDKKDITLESKEILKMDMMEQLPEEPFCSASANYVPQPSTCWWYPSEGGKEVVFSEAAESEGAPGESVNIVFGGF